MIFLEDPDLALYHGDAFTVLRELPAGVAQTCVTSPPYWGLRDYGTGQWVGGDEACDHRHETNHQIQGSTSQRVGRSNTDEQRNENYRAVCGRCGAQRVDSQLGLEPTPEEYVENMVALFREVRRVLRDDGTLWLNLGDSYASGELGRHDSVQGREIDGKRVTMKAERRQHTRLETGLKQKDLVGIPWRVAFALQQDGWYLRSDIIWSKPNPMPESVSDRPTKAHEYVFLFSKQARYFYDADAVREAPDPNPSHNWRKHKDQRRGFSKDGNTARQDGDRVFDPSEQRAGRNLRSVWQIATQPFPEAHFATYPEELVRRCILAGTSERGGCAECGAPWRRVTEHGAVTSTGGSANGARASNMATVSPLGQDPERSAYNTGAFVAREKVTTGWEPSCSCHYAAAAHRVPPPETLAQTVLDPFIGSGTTALVARKHGRRSIGVDLSAEYLAIAAKRTQQLSLLGGAAEEPTLRPHRGLAGGAYSPPGQSRPHSNARKGSA